MIDVNKILFRCHRLGDLMVGQNITEKQLLRLYELQQKEKLTDKQREELETLIEKRDSKELSETTKSYLKLMYRELLWDRKKSIDSRYLKKGLITEENSITLLSREKRIFFKKNDDRLSNDFITGIPDTQIVKEEGYEIKSVWDWTTLPYKGEPLEKKYFWQVTGYLALTGAKKFTVCFCLNNTPAQLIEDEKRKLSYKIQALDASIDPEYIAGCKELEKNYIYDIESFMKEYPWFELHNDISEWKWDIPRSQRLVTYEVERNDSDIERLYERIDNCRLWIKQNLL